MYGYFSSAFLRTAPNTRFIVGGNEDFICTQVSPCDDTFLPGRGSSGSAPWKRRQLGLCWGSLRYMHVLDAGKQNTPCYLLPWCGGLHTKVLIKHGED